MIYRYIKHPSRLTTIEVAFDGGMRAEYSKKYPNGTAHFMEHLRFKGGEKYSPRQFLEGTARIGAQWNAFTSEDLVSFHITVPEENVELAFDHLSQIALHPIFPEDEMEKERGVVRQEVRMYKDDIENINCEEMLSGIFTNFLSLPIQGTEASVDTITRQHILDFNKDFYNNQRAVCVVGQNDHRELVEKFFGTIDSDFNLLPTSKVKYAPSFNRAEIKEGFEQSSLIISYGGEQVEQMAQNRASVKVFNYIFGGGVDSRLWIKIREDLGLVYGIGSYLQETLEGSLFAISTLTQKKNIEQIVEETSKVIQDIKESHINEDELIRAQNMIKSSLYRQTEGSCNVSNREIRKIIYGTMDAEELIKAIDEVSIEDVSDVASSIFSGPCYVQKAVGNK